ncbi:GapA-binding peptide SR1P [Paenibacillus tarimensis]
MCKHCNHVIEEVDTEKSQIYYSICNQEHCNKINIEADRYITS